jgi:DNA-binding transcriptional LysR family regulator
MSNINIDLRQLRAFMAVARHGAFTRAAEEIYISQPGLSLLIRQLEEQLGVRLFDRSTRRVELTDAGHELAAAASRILDDVATMVADISDLTNLRRGRVSIAALPSLAAAFVPRVIARFRERYPDIRVIIHDAIAAPLIKMVENGEVDFGIGLRLQFERDLVFSELMTDRLVVLMPLGHHLEKLEEVDWESLVGAEFIAMTRDTSVRHLTDQAFAKIGQTLSPTYEASYMSTAISMVEAGLGITVLPSLALSSLRIPNVQVRPLNNPVIKREVGIIYKKNKVFGPAAQAFSEILKKDKAVKNLIYEISNKKLNTY